MECILIHKFKKITQFFEKKATLVTSVTIKENLEASECYDTISKPTFHKGDISASYWHCLFAEFMSMWVINMQEVATIGHEIYVALEESVFCFRCISISA